MWIPFYLLISKAINCVIFLHRPWNTGKICTAPSYIPRQSLQLLHTLYPPTTCLCVRRCRFCNVRVVSPIFQSGKLKALPWQPSTKPPCLNVHILENRENADHWLQPEFKPFIAHLTDIRNPTLLQAFCPGQGFFY